MSIRTLALITGVALLVVYLTSGRSTVVATGGPTVADGAALDTTVPSPPAAASPGPAADPSAVAPGTDAATSTAAPSAAPSATPKPSTKTTTKTAAKPSTASSAKPSTTKPAAAKPATSSSPSTTQAAAAVPMTAEPPASVIVTPTVLEFGVVHPWVVLSQRRLNALGYGQVEADGRFGPATQAAVVRFEQANGTTVDGRLEPPERLLLLSNDAVAYEPPAVPQPLPPSGVAPQPPVKLPPVGAGLATAATARTNANCQGIEAEFLRQGAEADVADQFAYVIAPRESGCWPQEVNSATDLSYSRLGLNFIGAMPKYWGNLCGVTDYHATADLAVDVKCGLAAYRALGWKPWSL